MIIVQISDIHCGPTEIFLKTKLTEAISEINALKPDVVILAGDLTENGIKSEFEEAKRFIDQITCPTKIFTMGNHDARHTGFIIFEELFGKPGGIFDGDSYTIVYVNTARPDRDEGRISRDQMELIEKAFTGSREKINILVMHHHLIPIPDTGLEKAIVEDAGDVLKAVSNLHTDLVLSGHRHRPWMWNLNGIDFVCAGAVSTSRLRGFFENSYNIIEITKDKIVPRLKIVGGPLLDFSQIVSAR